MAFHQPTRQISQRLTRPDPIHAPEAELRAPAPPLTQSRDESQTWVLFSPATDSGTTTSYLSSVQDEQPTPGRSRISDLGSLQTITHSDNLYSEAANSYDDDILEEDEHGVEDDAELDSLDSHLPEFRQQSGISYSTPILPGHDGLGGFRVDTQALSSEMQEQMYQFERYNPRRVKRRRESLEIGQLVLESEEAQEAARRRRIEDWRLEQSRVLLEEIQKETRRRRESTASAFTNRLRGDNLASIDTEADEATMSTIDDKDSTPDASMAGAEWHDQDASELGLGARGDEEASSFSRITRKVIRDLMGIDDKLLCVLFGEALPDELDLDVDDLSTTPKASSPDPTTHDEHDSAWQVRVLDRIARELGNLVSQLSAHPHPGAFSTYVRMQQQPLPYAGLPVIPEAAAVPAVAQAIAEVDSEIQNPATSPSHVDGSTGSAMPQFKPTLESIPHTRPIPIPRRNSDGPFETTGADAAHVPGTFTQQEWEQDLDIKLVFRYLRNRFTSSRTTASNPSPLSQPHTAISQDVASARAAARVRQHHPLVGVRPHQRRTSFKVTGGPSQPSQVLHVHGRHASSCASQSTRRSGRRGSMSVSSRHSSRHYWDIGAGAGGAGSIGTGSLITSTGPMGSWGEA